MKNTSSTSFSEQEGSELWRSVIDAIPDMLLVVDCQGLILYINHTPPGITVKQALGTNALEYVPVPSREDLHDSLQLLFATGATSWREQRVIIPDGTERWYATHTGPVRFEDQIVAAVVVAREITEAKRAELALAESEARYRTLVEYAPEAIVVFDVDALHFVDANQNACTLFGLDRKTLLDLNPVALSPTTQPDGRPSEVAAWQYLRSTLNGQAPCFEWSHLNAAGSEICCEVRLVKLPSLDHRLVRGSIIDVTQQRRLEQQILEWQKMDALGHFAAGIAHDFNNVLTMVLASADLLASDLKDEDHRADAVGIMTAARKGMALTTQLLAFARRQPRIDDGILDMNEVVREISTIISRLLGSDITLLLDLDSGRAPARIGRSQAEQVVMNLVLNARDAIEGEGTIHVTTRRRQGDRHSTLVSVSDNGSGIDPEVQRRMFEPFFSTKGGKGTGLGLSTVYGIVTQSGGAIEVRTAVGKGTTIDVLLRAE